MPLLHLPASEYILLSKQQERQSSSVDRKNANAGRTVGSELFNNAISLPDLLLGGRKYFMNNINLARINYRFSVNPIFLAYSVSRRRPSSSFTSGKTVSITSI